MLTHNTRDSLTAQRVDSVCLMRAQEAWAGAVWLERKGKLPYLVGWGGDGTTARVAGYLDIFGLEETICLHNRVCGGAREHWAREPGLLG